MGGKGSKALTHKDIRDEMTDRFKDLPEEDKKLFYFAITRVTKESKKMKLKSVEVCLNFTNFAVNVKSDDNPQSCFVVCHDGQGSFHADWETESPARFVYRLLEKNVNDFLSWLGKLSIAVASGVGGTARNAITYGQ